MGRRAGGAAARIAAGVAALATCAGTLGCAGTATRGGAGGAAGRADGCSPGLFVVDGACLGPREIDGYCGSRSVGSTCALAACGPGEGLDPRAGTGAPARTVRELVARDRSTPLPAGARLSCRDDRVLVAHGDHAGCLARSDACPRTMHASPSDPPCVADPVCPLGEVRAADGACVVVVSRGGLQVGAWTRAVLGGDPGAGDSAGTDGGAAGHGAGRMCRVLAQAPWELDVGPGGVRTVTLAVQLTFPDNDVSQATATVTAEIPPAALLATQAALDGLLIPLRALAAAGGSSDAASATVHLWCTVRGGSSPLVQAP